MKKGEIIELNIEKLVYGGDGIGKINGITVFIADTVSGDRVKAEIISVRKNYARALLKEITEPSMKRIKPFCALANTCGGCQWQHVDYKEQLKAKQKIVDETLQKIGEIKTDVKPAVASPQKKEYRCKIQFPVAKTTVSKRFIVGYYKKGTHDIINIKHCPVQPKIIDEVTAFLREQAKELNLTAYKEKSGKGLIRHFVYRYSSAHNNFLLSIVVNSDKMSESLIKLCNKVKENFPQAQGVGINFNTTRSNIILGENNKLVTGKEYIFEIIENKTFRISQGSFFQVNPYTARQMFIIVKKIISEIIESPKIIDIYAGSGGFSIFLNDIASHITAVESSESSVKDGHENIKENNITNIHYIKENADIAIPEFAAKGEKFDVTILDPPRKGCSEEVLKGISEITEKYLIYVSCNPATLARDMKFLKEKFRVKFAQPVDMFCHTYHVETILLAERIL